MAIRRLSGPLLMATGVLERDLPPTEGASSPGLRPEVCVPRLLSSSSIASSSSGRRATPRPRRALPRRAFRCQLRGRAPRPGTSENTAPRDHDPLCSARRSRLADVPYPFRVAAVTPAKLEAPPALADPDLG